MQNRSFDWKREYSNTGFILLEDHVPEETLDNLEKHTLSLIQRFTGTQFSSLIDPELCALVASDRELERKLYTEVRKFSWLTDFAKHSSIVEPVKALIGNDISLFEKIPMRLDLPLIFRELAVWHQDFHYVKGNTETVTAWVPLQDTTYDLGCLMVMPESHKLGSVNHDKNLLGKKQVPSDPEIYKRPVQYVEMKRGDLLLFNALLLHSSGNNLSDTIRVSIQARFTPNHLPIHPAMGQPLPV